MENKTSAERVRHALQKSGLDGQVVELPESTRTAVDAAHAVHCEVKQIAKSLIFKTRKSGQAILVITSGANRVNEEVVGSIVGEEIAVASADFVREQTGFAIGGVSPVGLIQKIPIFIDQDLLQVDEIWAAAGTPRSVFKVLPAQLLEITKGKVISVK
jgi:prolyl-tRNA editing enzyme YbaK/EbsC (Cys-tRNA(Pro) deacylase)